MAVHQTHKGKKSDATKSEVRKTKNKAQAQTVAVQQTQKKKSVETKSEVRKADKEKSDQQKVDKVKPKVLPSSHQAGDSSQKMVQSSPTPHADITRPNKEPPAEGVKKLKSLQKDNGQKCSKISGQEWPERKKITTFAGGRNNPSCG